MELTIPDILNDNSKNFHKIYENGEDDEVKLDLHDSLYYTESDFLDLIYDKKISNDTNLTIISLNIANLNSKLNSLKLFINNVSTSNNRPDIIIVVETHLNEPSNTSNTKEGLKNLVDGYDFFHKGRLLKKGGGVGVFVSKSLSCKANVCAETSTNNEFVEEHFENIVVRIPEIVPVRNKTCKKDLVVVAIYRQPGYNNLTVFQECLEIFNKQNQFKFVKANRYKTRRYHPKTQPRPMSVLCTLELVERKEKKKRKKK